MFHILVLGCWSVSAQATSQLILSQCLHVVYIIEQMAQRYLKTLLLSPVWELLQFEICVCSLCLIADFFTPQVDSLSCPLSIKSVKVCNKAYNYDNTDVFLLPVIANVLHFIHPAVTKPISQACQLMERQKVAAK